MKYTGERFIPDNNFCGPKTNIHREHMARYKFASKYVKGKKILDIACGEGYGCQMFIDNGASEVIGCDISEETINHAQKKYNNPKLEFLIQDIRNLDFENETFDCITCFETLEHVSDQEMMLNELNRVLKKNGFLIISTPNLDARTDDIDSNIFHEKELTVNEFKKLLNIFFTKIDLFSQRLVIKNNPIKNSLKQIITKIIKMDSKNLYTKIFPSQIYGIGYSMMDNTDKNYLPIPYQTDHKPIILIAVCVKL